MSNVRLSRSIRHVIVALIVVRAAKHQEILRLRRFLPLHIDVGLGSFVGRCSQVVLAVAGHADISQLYRTFVMIGVQARRPFVHVRRLHGFLGEGRYGRLPERLQFIHLVALSDGLGRYPAEVVDSICPQSPVVHLIVIGTCGRFDENFKVTRNRIALVRFKTIADDDRRGSKAVTFENNLQLPDTRNLLPL